MWARRAVLGVVVALSGLLCLAQTSDEAAAVFELDYQASAGCPTRDAFLREIQSRSQRARLAGPGESGVHFNVRIEARAGSARGSVVLLDDAGVSAPRQMQGRNCEELAHALALSVALTLDPAALSRPTPIDASPDVSSSKISVEASPGDAGSEPPATPATDAALGLRLDGSPQSQQTPTPSIAPPEPRANEGPKRFSAGLGLAGELQFGVTPDVLPAARVSLRLGWEEPAFAPSLRLSAARGVDSSGGDGDADFTLTEGQLELCVRAATLLRWLQFEPCGCFDAGVLRAEGGGDALTTTESARRPWLAPGGRLRLRGVWNPLVLGVSGGLSANLIRDRFVYLTNQGEALVHRASPVSGVLALELGLEL